MKNLRSMPAAILVIMVTIIAGCSDTITSSGETGVSKKGEQLSATESKLPYIETIRMKLSIKPQSAYNFNSKTTGFQKFYSIDVNRVSREIENSKCEGIAVFSTDLGKFIECHSSGFELNEIMVKNTGSTTIHVEVLLRGFKQKVIKLFEEVTLE